MRYTGDKGYVDARKADAKHLAATRHSRIYKERQVRPGNGVNDNGDHTPYMSPNPTSFYSRVMQGLQARFG